MVETTELEEVPTLDFGKKYCFDCCHFLFYGPEPGYSELTPGSDAILKCTLGMWDLLNYCNVKTFRECIESAEKCPKFLARKM